MNPLIPSDKLDANNLYKHSTLNVQSVQKSSEPDTNLPDTDAPVDQFMFDAYSDLVGADKLDTTYFQSAEYLQLSAQAKQNLLWE